MWTFNESEKNAVSPEVKDENNVVIVGGGAGGLELAVGLAKKYKNNGPQVILIDRDKTHLWKPHLHEVASGTLDSSFEQIDYLSLANKFGFNFVWGEMNGLDKEAKEVILKEKINSEGETVIPQRRVKYTQLVIGVGSTSNDFGTPGVKDYAFSLDNVWAANTFHKTMLEKILHKEYTANENNTKLDFKIIIVGGGATGVELASELSQTTQKLSQFGLKKLNDSPIEISVINAADQLLPGLSQKIADGAKEVLQNSGVKVFNSTKVVEVKKQSVKIKLGKNLEGIEEERELFCDMIVWAAGVKSPDFLAKLGLEVNRGNQFVVSQSLQTSDASVFAIGDCASVKWINGPKEGLMVPPRAQSAHQMSDYLIENLADMKTGKKVEGFVYKDFGSLISLGAGEGVGTLMGFLKIKSFFVEGKIAKFMYLNLYHHHQVKINGILPAMGMLAGKLIHKQFKPSIKLH